VARRGGARPSGTSHGAALLGAEADGGGKRSQLSGQALLFLALSQLPVGRPWRPDARNGGGRYFFYRLGGRYFIYRPPLRYVSRPIHN